MLWRCEYIPLKIALHHHSRNNSAITSSKCSLVYVIISESPETRLVPFSIRAISMHIIESRGISNRKYLSKTILACRERQAKNTFRKCPSLYDSIWRVHSIGFIQWKRDLSGYGKARVVTKDTDECEPCLWCEHAHRTALIFTELWIGLVLVASPSRDGQWCLFLCPIGKLNKPVVYPEQIYVFNIVTTL